MCTSKSLEILSLSNFNNSYYFCLFLLFISYTLEALTNSSFTDYIFKSILWILSLSIASADSKYLIISAKFSEWIKKYKNDYYRFDTSLIRFSMLSFCWHLHSFDVLKEYMKLISDIIIMDFINVIWSYIV